MASSSILKRRARNSAAFTGALLFHVLMLIILASVRPPLPNPAYEYVPPVDITLFPELSQGAGAEPGGTSSALGQGALLRRLETGAAAVPGQPAPAPQPVQAVADAPAPPSEALRRLDTPAEPPPAPAFTPPALPSNPVSTPARPTANLRPAQTLTVEPDITETVRPTDRPVINRPSPLTAAAPPATPSALRRAQTLTVEPDISETVQAEAPAAPQPLRPVTAAAAPAAPSALRRAQALTVEPDISETVRAQAPAAPAQTAPVTAAARPAGAQRLEAPKGLAAAAPSTANEAAPARAQAAAGPPTASSSPSPSTPGAGPSTRPGPAQVAGRPGTAPPGPGPGCEPEVLMLLTPAERERCRNQIDAAKARLANRNAATDAARRVQEMRRLPGLDNIPIEKRAYYDAVQTAKAQVRNDFRAAEALGRDHTPGVGKATNLDIGVGARCSATFGVNKGKPDRPRFSLGLGMFSCPVAPPVGMGTEEARIKPP